MSGLAAGVQMDHLRCLLSRRLPRLIGGQVRVVVETVSRDGDRLETLVRVIEGNIPRDIESPASLFRERIEDGIELHRGRRVGSGELSFSTFGTTASPSVDDVLTVQWWWPAETQQMLVDASEWRRTSADAADCFCPLTYESMIEGEDAYTDGRGNCISVRGWEQFVRDDRLHLRPKPEAIEPTGDVVEPK